MKLGYVQRKVILVLLLVLYPCLWGAGQIDADQSAIKSAPKLDGLLYKDVLSSKSEKETADMKLRPFHLKDVRLLEGPFKDAQDLHSKVLLKYEPDRLLAWFRKEAGLRPKAKVYGGWESQAIAGHSLGHYLSGCALMYASTGDNEFKKRVDYVVNELALCQDADGDGYIGAFKNGKKIFSAEIAQGDIRSQGFDLNGLWVPFYTQHKIYNGLRDAYRLCGNQEALSVAEEFAIWLETVIGHLSDDQMQRILACEYGGMNESLADLYNDTGDEQYLMLAHKFHHKAILDPLSKGIDCLPGKHANTQVPKLVGLARLYELTGNDLNRKTAEFFWDCVVNHHSYVTGGHCIDEHFGPPDTLNDRLGTHTTETCNVYNMLKLTRHLIQWGQVASAGDFYERALFNHIFATQHPVDGRVIYNLTLEMGGHKHYQDPFGFTCCVGTGMENHAKYGDSIYFHSDDSLYVNLFIASELNWKNRGLTIRQETSFPDTDSTTLIFTCRKPTELAVQYRCPYWARQGVLLSINGKEQRTDVEPGQLGEIKRIWRAGDRLTIRIPMDLRLETMPDNKNRVAIMYGPLVLAGDLGEVDDSRASDTDFVPVLIADDRDPSQWIKPVQNKCNTFKMVDTGHPRNVTLIPFYRMHDRRYSIYWDMYTPRSWKQEEKTRRQALEEQKKLQDMTVDFVQPGEMQPERDHNMQGKHTSAGTFKGRKWRHARNGWFSFDMKVLRNEPVTMQATYWGSDAGNRGFDILVDGTKVATQVLNGNKPDEFCVVNYNLPVESTQGKDKVTIRFQSHEGETAGGLFGLRIVSTKALETLKDNDQVYLFSSFRGNGEDGLHLAYSEDGLTWTNLNNDQSYLKPKIGGKLMRDPCVIQGPDGLFHMVWTTSWTDQGIGVAHSRDLMEWSEQQFVPVMQHESKSLNCWAPEITWDPDGEQYVIYWATTIRGHFGVTEKTGDGDWNHRMYCTTTKDFKTYTPTRLFYEPGFNVIDSTIIRHRDHYVMILKDETRHPPAKNLRVAASKKVTGPWSKASKPFSPEGLWVEGPSCLQVGEYWYVYFDAYGDGKYGVMRTKDFRDWEDISSTLHFPEGTRHGTAFTVTSNVLQKLLKGKSNPDDETRSTKARQLPLGNTVNGQSEAPIKPTREPEMTMVSPNGHVQLLLNNENGQIQFSQVFNGHTLLSTAAFGVIVNGIDSSQSSAVEDIEISSFDETWKTVNGKYKEVRNHYNEYHVNCRAGSSPSVRYQVIFRCYDDGFAYRYRFPEQTSFDTLTFSEERTELNFTDNYVWWSYNGEHHNVGPVSSLDSTPKHIRSPMVLKFDTGSYMAILEGEIVNYAPFELINAGKQNTVKLDWPETTDSLPLKTSWRTFIVGRNPGDLVESNLLVNLNEPCKIEDPSWIKPGKTLWDWRTLGYIATDGFTYKMDTVSHKRLIDFASKNNIQYLLMDANWYGAEFNRGSDPTTAQTAVHIEENMAYAKRKGVGIILYLNDVGAKQFGLERVLKKFSEWGAVGVKYGFMNGTSAEKVKQTRRVVEMCAKYKLMVNFHDNPIPPSGDRRTWPNLITKEFCQARADGPKPCIPETAVTSPFVNMIAGPLDYSDGWFDLNKAQHRSKTPYKLQGTVVSEVAKLIVTYTGWMVLPDCPEEYLIKDDLFACIRKMSLPFDSFRVLDGQIGEYISVARQSGENWFVGSLTNRDARSIDIDFSFLPEGVSYMATLYEDTEDSHFLDNKESYKIRTIPVNSTSRVRIKMGPGGGHAIYLNALL